jgi:hypothetical protein
MMDDLLEKHPVWILIVAIVSVGFVLLFLPGGNDQRRTALPLQQVHAGGPAPLVKEQVGNRDRLPAGAH